MLNGTCTLRKRCKVNPHNYSVIQGDCKQNNIENPGLPFHHCTKHARAKVNAVSHYKST